MQAARTADRLADLVEREHSKLSVRVQCDLLGVSRSSAGVKVGPKAIARMAELVAPQMRAAHAAAKQEQNTAAIPVMYIEGDGTGVPVRKSEARGRKAKNGEGEARTREVKLGCVFTQTSPDPEGKPQRDHNSTTYVGTLQCSEDFGILLRREAFARGFASAQKTVYLGDGAAWVWEVARINFPQATCILDFYHAGEHLSLLAETLYSADPPRVQSQATLWRAMLLEDRLQEVLAQARNDLPDIPGPRSAAQKQIAYFETNSSRMTYATFRSQGLLSESGSKTPACSGPSRGRRTSWTSELSCSATGLTTSGSPETRKPHDPR